MGCVAIYAENQTIGFTGNGGVMAEKVMLTKLAIKATNALVKCTFRVGSYNKRFAQDIARIANSDTPELTQKQYDNLWRLVWRYRRQIKDKKLIVMAGMLRPTEENKPVDPGEQHIYDQWPKFKPETRE